MAVLLVIGAYVLGSIPFGMLFARTAGIDVRRAGSGTIGATNVARTAGARLGIATLLADVAKGALPVVAARALGAAPAVGAAAGLAAFLGHVFPVTLGFAGGKGVATGLGALVVLNPVAAASAAGVFALVLAGSGYVSLASMLAAIAAPLVLAVAGAPRPTLAVGSIMAIVILARHRDNVRRLLAGTEPRLHKKQAPPTE